MAKQKKKVLVVDDSAFMRKAITRMIHSDPAFEVMATAKDGYEALQLIMDTRPDVVTLDVEMPKMNGLETMIRIHELYPFLPVIIVSSIARSGTDLAIQCLEAGAYEIVCKPESYVAMNILEISHDLLSKLRAAVNLKPARSEMAVGYDEKPPLEYEPIVLPEKTLPELSSPEAISHDFVVTIGASTGGPVALQKLFSAFPPDIPAAFVVVQHMPPGGFIHSLADRLNSQTPLKVKVAEEGDLIRNGHVYIGPIGKHLILIPHPQGYALSLSFLPKGLLHCPAVDVLFRSAGEVVGHKNISCILTGMGYDGTKGLEWVFNNQGYVIAESEESCVVYGMPRSAVEAGLVHETAPIHKIPDILMNRLQYHIARK